ncbi:DUF1289 domain-containing protein [Flocculibacter collagenilyticus]|uniref:DUF1289 domain-containing protein n=1 Tax=Flocculibacter collagenilyticus TaxID=2744479 RepID=UPI0018F72571|nr:DUF1289 domain-containing protein [Flocculibacter collagenilyticus]
MTVSSPCVSCCKLDENDICMGCYRSMNEIANWSQSNDEYKLQVLEHVKEREHLYKEMDYHTIDKYPITRNKHMQYKKQS